VFDEPTSSLSEVDAQRLMGLIEDLKGQGVTIVYVSHRMPEVLRLGDRVSILRDGRYIGTLGRAEASPDRVVEMMIGRSVEAYFPQHLAGTTVGDVRLRSQTSRRPGSFATSRSRSAPARSSGSRGSSGRAGAK
jgi:ABC-type sugar transport system ATPase subunit